MAKDLRDKTSSSAPQALIGKILLIAAVLVCLGAVWLTRMSRNYVYMFLDHYQGTTAILADMKGVQRSAEDRDKLLPLQEAFDDWKQTHLRDDVSVAAADGAVLQGGLYDAGSDVTVILFHSFDGSSAASDYLCAPYYAEKGYNILLPDSRDHGDSEGAHVTYGLLEGGDAAAWVRWLIERYGEDHQIILHGADLGANAALVGAAQLQIDAQMADAVRFVVAERPIVNLYDGALYLLKNQFGIPGLVVRTADRYAKQSLGGCSMRDVDLVRMTDGCSVPLLVIQETGDTLIDPESVSAFCDGYAGICERYTPNGAHGMAYADAPDTFRAALDTMITQYIR